MSKVKWMTLAALVGTALLVVGCSSFKYKNEKYLDVPYTKTVPNDTVEVYQGIVRLHNLKNEFFCTGVVISNEYAITAAHCIVGMTGSLSGDEIKVVNHTQEFSVAAYPAGANNRQDYGIIRGDFSQFKKAPIVYDTITIEAGKTYAACGFPMGQRNMFCSRVDIQATDYFWIQGFGFMYPGMSGGPVIDMETGEVIGVNSHVNPNTVSFSPLIGILATFNIEPKQ